MRSFVSDEVCGTVVNHVLLCGQYLIEISLSGIMEMEVYEAHSYTVFFLIHSLIEYFVNILPFHNSPCQHCQMSLKVSTILNQIPLK